MDCENCGQHPAKVHMTEIVNDNEKRERHLCEECADKEGLLAVKQNFSISELLAGLAASHLAGKAGDVPDVKCPSCGITFAEFQSAGRFGCAEDYEVFGEHIVPRLERFHDSSQHVGKSPRGGANSQERASYVLSLRAQLREAVAEEAYERAAKLRDEIKKAEAPRGEEARGS